MYQLESSEPGVRWMVASGTVQPLHGVTRTVEFNIDTGEMRPIERASPAASHRPVR